MMDIEQGVSTPRPRDVKANVHRPSAPSEDQVRFETLFHEHADAVLAYALRRSDPDTAQEIVAETFTVAWRRIDVVPESALPWLLGTARRTLSNGRRTAIRRQALTLRLAQEPPASDDRTAGIDLDLAARAALASLPTAEREAMELVAWEGLSPTEAAEVLGCSRRAIAVRMHRARRRLRGPLKDVLSADPTTPTQEAR
ncbi:MAG: RNA polymerase sigma factor [Actinomycetota bacterium]